MEEIRYAVGLDATADRLVELTRADATKACALVIEAYRDANYAPGQPNAPAAVYDALTEAARLCRDVGAAMGPVL